MDQIRSSNEQKYYTINTPAQPETSSVPNEIRHQTPSVDGSNGSIKSIPSVASKEKEARYRLTVFMALLFAAPNTDIHGLIIDYTPITLTENVKEVFEFVSSTTDQARMIGENLTAFSVEVSEEKFYLLRLPLPTRISMGRSLATHLRRSRIM